MKRLVSICFIVFLFFQVLEGVIKYALSTVGFTYFIYLPKILLIVVIILKLLPVVQKLEIRIDYFIVVGLVFLGLITGLFFVNDKTSVFFGLYTLLPFVFGYISAEDVDLNGANYNVIKLLFFLAFFGIIIDMGFDLPWEGFSYETFGRENEGSRDWNQFELQRPAGFSVISWAAASHLAVFGVIIISRNKSLFIWMIYILLMLLGILITTTKGVIIALICSFFFLLTPKRLKVAAFYFALIFSITLPLSTMFFKYELPKLDSLFGLLTYSFFIRLTEAWPRFFEIFDTSIIPLTGKGFGSFGQASYRTYTSDSHAVDSFFLYIIGIFGIPGFTFIYLRIIKKFHSFFNNGERVNYVLLFIFIIYGLIVSGVEFGIWGLILGYLLGKRSTWMHSNH